jgi:uncharacterized OsmC-like protein
MLDRARRKVAHATMTTATAGNGEAAPQQRTLRCRTVAGGGSHHLTYVRELPPMRVEERLGVASELVTITPSEIMLAALGSCLATRIHAGAVAGSIALREVEIEVEVDVATSPMWGSAGREPVPVGFEAIRVIVHIQADAPADALRSLIAHAVRWSPVANTLHNPVHLDVTVAGQS